MKPNISKSGLAVVLSKLKGFKQPKVRLEQYTTDSEIAADMLWNCYMRGDIAGKRVIDLGCGTGILGIGALLLGAKKVIFVDVDADAIEIAKTNLEGQKSEYEIIGESEFIVKDVDNVKIKGDTLIENPPFGVKVEHADRRFLVKAAGISDVVYTMHKSESVMFINAFAKDNNLKVSDSKKYSFPLKLSYDFHKKKAKHIDVVCFRLVRER